MPLSHAVSYAVSTEWVLRDDRGGDLDLVTHVRLRKVLACGPNFRDGNANASALDALEAGLTDLAHRLKDNDTPLSSFGNWSTEILRRCAEHLDAIHPNNGGGNAQRP